MNNEISLNANLLEQLIIKRKDFEEKNPYSPYSDFPTDWNFKDKHGFAPLHYAAKLGNVNKIIELVSKRANVNLSAYIEGMTPLKIAVTAGNLQCAQKLIELGASSDDVWLYEIKEESCRNWLKDLLEQKFKKNEDQKIVSDFSPNFFSPQHSDLEEQIKQLLEAANINYLDFIKKNLSRLYSLNSANPNYIIQEVTAIACRSGYLDLLKLVFSSYPEYFQQLYYRHGPLHLAIEYKQKDILNFLCEKVDWNSVNIQQQTILHIACMIGDIEIVKLVIKQKPELILKQDIFLNNCLMIAINFDHTDIVELIIDTQYKEKLLEQKNILKITALQLAAGAINPIRTLFDLANEKIESEKTNDYSQVTVNPAVNYFGSINYLGFVNYNDIRGACVGHGKLFSILSAKYEPEFFYKNIDMLFEVNNSPELAQIKAKEKMSGYEINSELTLLQQLSFSFVIETLFQNSQVEQNKEFNLTYKKIGIEVKDFYSYKDYNCEKFLTLQDVKKQCKILNLLPVGVCVDLSANRHNVQLFFSGNNIVYFDSNLSIKVDFENIDQAIEFFYKSIYLPQKFTNYDFLHVINIKPYYFPKFLLEKLNRCSELNDQEIFANFILASMANDLELKKLVITKIPKNFINSDNVTQLLYYSYPDLEITQSIVELGADINALLPSGKTLLHYLIEQEDVQKIQYFLQFNPNVTIADNEGRTIEQVLEKASYLIQRIFDEYKEASINRVSNYS